MAQLAVKFGWDGITQDKLPNSLGAVGRNSSN